MKIKVAEFLRSVYSSDDLPGDNFPQIAFAGRSNVGKSSMINCLLPQKNLAKISSQPGKTRSINFFLINHKIYFVDLPGYGYARVSKTERQRWKSLIESYLLQNQNLKALVQIIDSRIGITKLDQEMLLFANAANAPLMVVATKIDKLKPNERNKQLSLIEKILVGHGLDSFIPFSAKSRVGKQEVLQKFNEFLNLK